MSTKIFDPLEATRTVKHCVCADCWEPLIERYDTTTRTSTVNCITPGCPCNGYITIRSADRQIAEGRALAAQARADLQAAGVLPAPVRKTEAQLLAELGF